MREVFLLSTNRDLRGGFSLNKTDKIIDLNTFFTIYYLISQILRYATYAPIHMTHSSLYGPTPQFIMTIIFNVISTDSLCEQSLRLFSQDRLLLFTYT